MRGDFTRDTRKRELRMGTRSVLIQEGRQLLDANWNQQAGVDASRAEQAAVDTIGQQGAPREDAGFQISVSGGSLTVGEGAIYAEGLRCTNHTPVLYEDQVADGILPGVAEGLANGDRALVYLDAGTRPALPVDDTFLYDPGLVASDTAIHELIDWTVRLAPLDGIGMSEADIVQNIDRNQPIDIAPFARTTGGLDADVQTEDEVTDPGPCELPPTAGYLDILNQLYRVEIHSSGTVGTAQFKWTHDAGIEAGIRMDGANLYIDLPPDRHTQWFKKDTVVELIDADEMRAGVGGKFGTIKSERNQPLEVEGIDAGELLTTRRLRAWASMPQDIPPAGDWVVLDKGIKIRFAEGHYERGAGWTIPGRTRINDICWPPYNNPDLQVALPGEGDVGFYHPTDGERRYTALAIVRRNASNFSVLTDLRQVFPPLTDLTADAVRYDNEESELEATNVQDAIDELAARACSHCMYTVEPGPDWEDVFDQIPAGANATVCFTAGTFNLKRAHTISGKGDLRIIGAGSATRLIVDRDCSALRFVNCRDVDVCDMAISAQTQRTHKAKEGSRTKATLEIANCARVRVERMTLIAQARRWRQAACLRIDVPLEGKSGAGDVIVRDCDIVAGDLATGILVLNANHARIRDNRIRVRNEKAEVTGQRWIEDTMVSNWMGGLLFSHPSDEERKTLPTTRSSQLYEEVRLDFGDRLGRIFAYTHRDAKPIWEEFNKIYITRAEDIGKIRHITSDIIRLTSGLFAKEGAIFGKDIDYKGFFKIWEDLSSTIQSVADTGIVVAGERAGDISISGNSIDGALQGIRVAVDRGVPTQRLRITSVRMHDNRIVLPVVPLDRVRHGIYVGNAKRCWVVDNDISLAGADARTDAVSKAIGLHLDHIHCEGIRVSGLLGKMVQVRGNAVQGCRHGITVFSSVPSGDALRIAQANMIANAERPWTSHNGLVQEDNNPA
jgi:hypothetical protein